MRFGIHGCNFSRQVAKALTTQTQTAIVVAHAPVLCGIATTHYNTTYKPGRLAGYASLFPQTGQTQKLSPNDRRIASLTWGYHGYFPNLNVAQAVVTDNASSAYNCIAWTVGITNRWIWPGGSLAHFDTFYRGYGFVRLGNGPIAAWGTSTAGMTHGSVSGPGHGARWESKCGRDLRIQHGLNELVGGLYGRVLAFYSKGRSLPAPFAAIAEDVMNEKLTKSYLSVSQKKLLQKEEADISAKVRTAFETAFSAWQETWFSGGLAVSSDPHTRAVGREFDALIALGPAILPLLIEKLADPENFFALQLYDAMQSDHNLLVQYEPDDERIVEGEQGRARRVVQAWFANR
jgi:hypothetical protein